MTTEQRTARLTILVDPHKKEIFEQLCAEEDATPSQVLRRLMRHYIEERTGQPWSPAPSAPVVLHETMTKSRRAGTRKVEK